MALMFPRLARNFAKNGYFPTDEATLERTLCALEPSTTAGPMCILDPCAGEGVALAEVAHALGREQVRAYAVEYDAVRASHARGLLDRCLHSDLMDTMISRQVFGLLWLNPPYGDLPRDQMGAMQFQGRARLEKLFYQRTLPLLQYGGVLVFIIPSYVLDAELVGWLTGHFANMHIYRAVDTQFKQVVIFGERIRQRDQVGSAAKSARNLLLQVGRGEVELEELPNAWPYTPYAVPSSITEPEHFYRVSMEPDQLAAEIHRLQGLWPALDTHLGSAQRRLRPPARALSHWHLALALAAGAISGVVKSKTGRILVVRGDTHKEKSTKTEFEEQEDGSIRQTRILTDKFVPVIRAWDVTPGSTTEGQVLTIR